MIQCAYIEVVHVDNDHLNCLEVGVTLIGASVPSAHYTHEGAMAKQMNPPN